MTGKDLTFALQYIGDDLVAEAEFTDFGNQAAKTSAPGTPGGQRKAAKKAMLIAAIITIFLLLTGFTLLFFTLERLVVPKVIPETTSSPVVAQNILSLQGYEGSPTYQALSEWLAFQASYVAQDPELRFNSDFRRPDDYYNYPCYTQEMVDKVDELCEKYGLHTIGKPVFITNQAEAEQYGLAGILSQAAAPRCLYGHVFHDGTFVMSGELELSQDFEKIVQFQMRSLVKNAFYTVPLGLNDLSDFLQWNYRTKDGCTALLAVSHQVGLIFVEKEDRFISIVIDEVPASDGAFTGLPDDTAFLEAVCDCFVF